MNVYATPVSNVTGYINYFRQLAVDHSLIRHNPDSESGDGAIGTMHFSKISEEEYLVALNKVAGFPFLALELYEVESESQVVSDVRLLPKGAFSVVDNPADQSFTSVVTCYQNAERILYDILKHIYQDHFGLGVDECQAPFKFFEVGQLAISPIGPVFSGQYGYRCIFDFELQKAIDITQAPAAGVFLINES
ncbi:MAG TPA: hypothetical protein VHA52_09750 [Candidatus Babeliaceae bacterium]|nr:hypothetical protein [Candidatus Babeliaceae bacterium]HVZ96430.1 hypothetical protein [Chitinophagaceae bacterium]